ncbi:MAG: PSD1 and planctomycete cytochrome C domain-containing protein [Bryobacterales bacterium]|nr:PSD1 and planctomycete cytochrome C domain-containing protein [Bryobacterales bacterium]
MFLKRLIITNASLLLVMVLAWPALAQQPVDFVTDIQPVLRRACLQCHGEKMQMGNLRLDAKALAAHTIQPGKAEASSLYIRVAGLDDQPRMPMGGKPLAPEVIERIKRWIDEGATWPDSASAANAAIRKHWAYVPPKRSPLPQVANTAWARNAVDRFILARLEQEKLQPSPEADRPTLLRRLSLDLVGLPPSPEEVDAFVNDRSPHAYQKQVERLLASPHYGERWGRVWLDAARYADSDGFEKDKQRWVWFYRDWVIQALNQDLPYDQFILHQLAGDLLPNATQETRVATGFLRNSMINEEGGIDPEQFRVEATFDRMEAIGKGILGITIQCAQCHNHKFDPISQEEYYRIFAFLNNAHEANISVYTHAEEKKRQELLQEIARSEEQLQARSPGWRPKFEQWKAARMAAQPEWHTFTPEVDDISTGGQKYLKLDDGSLMAAGYAPTRHRVKLTAALPEGAIRALRLDLLLDPNLPRGGPGRSLKGTGALTEFEAEIQPADATAKAIPVRFTQAYADLNLPESPIDEIHRDKKELAGEKAPRVTGPIAYAIDGKADTAWGIDAGPGRRNQPRSAVFVPAEPIRLEAGAKLVIRLNQSHGGWNSDDNQNLNLGRFRLSYTKGDVREAPVPLDFAHFRDTVDAWQETNARIEALWREHPEGSTQLVLDERRDMRSTRLLKRGDFLNPGQTVEPGVPAVLHPLDSESANEAPRLRFARWLVSRESPTTARSFVNRIWQAYFGIGIVETAEDLGKQSPAASHPELLDWLAVDFMENGWRIKDLHRLIVTSSTYRQSSRQIPELREKDPYNRLLARAPRFRVDGEAVRDIALAASGLLHPEVGGPSVYPPAPDFLFQPPASYGPKIWNEAKDVQRYRRALYTFRYRSVPYPVLTNFDVPNGDTSCVRRDRSNTPLQALTTLNEPLFYEAAQALAARTLADGGTDDATRLQWAFARCTSRKPTDAEQAELTRFLALQQQRFGDPQQAWTAVARLLLNLDETITKE